VNLKHTDIHLDKTHLCNDGKF